MENVAEEVSDVIAIEPIDLILERLASEGFRPEKVGDKTIRLRCEGRSVWVEHDIRDNNYYQVFCADIWELESPEEVQWALEAANHVSSSLKIVKAYVTTERRNVWIEGSGFYKETGEFLDNVVRLVEITRLGQSRFVDKIREIKNSAETAKLH